MGPRLQDAKERISLDPFALKLLADRFLERQIVGAGGLETRIFQVAFSYRFLEGFYPA